MKTPLLGVWRGNAAPSTCTSAPGNRITSPPGARTNRRSENPTVSMGPGASTACATGGGGGGAAGLSAVGGSGLASRQGSAGVSSSTSVARRLCLAAGLVAALGSSLAAAATPPPAASIASIEKPRRLPAEVGRTGIRSPAIVTSGRPGAIRRSGGEQR